MAEVARPNILVIIADDAGYHDFGFMGSEDIPTPHLDSLAEMGTIFSDAHVTATVCSPSRAGLMTGRYQQAFGHECNVPPHTQGMEPSEHTLADALKTAGYRTMAVGKWHLGNRSVYHPNVRGFDEFYGFLEGSRSYFPNQRIDHPENYHAILRNRTQVDFDGYLTDVLTNEALGLLEESKDQPWFMFLSYNAPHTPMEAKEEDLQRFTGHPRQTYAAMMASMDDNIGRVRDWLDTTGQMQNTLIFFLSDNGGAENNQSSNVPLKGWKGNKFEGGHRVPFFVTWKGRLPSGHRFDGLTSALDIFATSIAAAGLEKSTGKPLHGTNLIPYLTGVRDGDPHQQLFWRKDKMAAMRQGPMKLIRLEGLGFRLYDLSSDLAESVDLRDELPDLFTSMAESMEEWERTLVAPYWYEDEGWNAVTYEIHHALMENRKPNFRTPTERTAFLRKSNNP